MTTSAPASSGLRSSPASRISPATDSSPAPRLSAAGRVLVWLFTSYQFARSGHPSPCRFTPTCSSYAIEAVTRHGARHGLSLALRRLGRCRPGGPSGYDPVPE
jgi:putative membrane protein insertion efficiency factor